MSEAILNETLLSYVQRRNQINMQITHYQNSKTLAAAETSDLAEWKTSKYSALRTECKNIFSMSYKDSTYSYVDYTEIPEYTEEVEYIDCYYEAEVAAFEAGTLPFTGGTGSILYTIIGMITVISAILLFVLYTRQKKQQAQS